MNKILQTCMEVFVMEMKAQSDEGGGGYCWVRTIIQSLVLGGGVL